jgi:hypothetical protein
MYILVTGTPIEGFNFDGLFTNELSATTFGELKYPNKEWWIAPITLKNIPIGEEDFWFDVQAITNLLFDLTESLNHKDMAASRLNAVSIANYATKLYNEIVLSVDKNASILSQGYNGHAGAGEDAPIQDKVVMTEHGPVFQAEELTAHGYCVCGHSWSQHTQNVHRTWVCTQCTCRGMNPPSENPN